jgi:tetratricopeptide (TPR) repeat protein
MPKTISCSVITLAALLALAWPASAQDPRPLGPDLEPAQPVPTAPGEEQAGRIPLPLAGNRAAAAASAHAGVPSVLPPGWSAIVGRYQPLWDAVSAPAGFGLERWGSYFAAAGIVPQLSAHPFLSPWGMLSTEGWLFDRYRAAWDDVPPGDERLDQAAEWLQRGDRAMAEGRSEDAVLAYRRVTQTMPELPLGWLALGAALAQMGEDDEADRAFRQGFDRYPPWIAPALDWQALYGDADRLVALQSAAAERAVRGSSETRFVAGVLHLFGGAPATGRRLLSSLVEDPHAAALLARGPR